MSRLETVRRFEFRFFNTRVSHQRCWNSRIGGSDEAPRSRRSVSDQIKPAPPLTAMV